MSQMPCTLLPPEGDAHTPLIEEPTQQRSTMSLEEDDIEVDETPFSAPQLPAGVENLPTLSPGRTHVTADAVKVPSVPL